jgi:hypothetical protein
MLVFQIVEQSGMVEEFQPPRVEIAFQPPRVEKRSCIDSVQEA